MASNRIAIIGTDIISASIGYALREREESIELVGYDANPAVADLAKVRGAFGEVRRKPGPACEGAELVIVAQPLAEIESTLEAISPHLEDGTVVTDTARLKAPVLRWAEKALPGRVSFVGGHLIPNPAVIGVRSLEGLEDASADLMREALYCYTPSPSTPGDAIDVCSWLARAIGAHPFFIDVKEHDGLLAGVEGLPDLLTVALLRATVDTPGWEEMRKFAGRRFAAATEAVDDVPVRHPSLFLNRENVVHRLDALIEELVRLRGVLMKGDEEALSKTLTEAAEGRSRWINERQKGMWSEEGATGIQDVPGPAKQLGNMLFGGLASRFQRRAGEPDDE
jgi:prephenate dehydrogenase